MPANLDPIYPLTPKVQWAPAILTANTAKDGTGTVALVFTAGANGAKIDQIKVRPIGTNTASVMRFFVNNGSVNSTPANNTLVHEVSLPAITISEVAQQADIDVLIPKALGVACPIPYLPAGYKINVTIGTTVAAGWVVTVFGGDY